jgi:hypothetical protein
MKCRPIDSDKNKDTRSRARGTGLCIQPFFSDVFKRLGGVGGEARFQAGQVFRTFTRTLGDREMVIPEGGHEGS